MSALPLSDLLLRLEELAPPAAAAAWDNVGLLLEPARPAKVQRILLTLDLTEAVVEEALKWRPQLIISYHPPIFRGLKSLTLSQPLTAPLLRLLEAGVAVYSPHTALDAAEDGMSDWLCGVVAHSAMERIDGSARLLTLDPPLSLPELAAAVTAFLELPYLRLAKAPKNRRKIRTLALCPGAGAQVLADIPADAVLTGEMKHHDLLAFMRAGRHVLISEHTHTERPYLTVYRRRLLEKLPGGIEIRCARGDQDPVELVLTGYA